MLYYAYEKYNIWTTENLHIISHHTLIPEICKEFEVTSLWYSRDMVGSKNAKVSQKWVTV